MYINSLNTFAAKRDCSRIYRSLPNATTVEIDNCLFLTVIMDANLFYFKMFIGHNIIIYGKYAIFCTRIDFTKMFVMSLDLADVKNNETIQGNDIQDALSTSTAIF